MILKALARSHPLSQIGIDGELLAGSLPQKQFKMLVGWLALHEEEAYAAWNKAVKGEHFDKIKPLRRPWRGRTPCRENKETKFVLKVF